MTLHFLQRRAARTFPAFMQIREEHTSMQVHQKWKLMLQNKNTGNEDCFCTRQPKSDNNKTHSQ